MRDNNSGMIELVDAISVDNHYFSIIRHCLDGEHYTLKFGIIKEDYSRLKNILTYRPFESTGVGKYRYFFADKYQKNSQSENVSTMFVRIEQATQHKQFPFPVGNKYLSNLLWFSGIKDRKILEPFIVV